MKRKGITLTAILGCSVILCCLYFIGNKPAETSQVPTPPKMDVPPSPYVPTPEEQKRRSYLRELRDPLPEGSLYTFGMAAKLCDWVIVGTVEEATYMTEFTKTKRSKANHAGEIFIGYRVVLSVDRSLHGKSKEKK